MKPLDFENAKAAADHINQIISDATKGRLTQIVDAGMYIPLCTYVTIIIKFGNLNLPYLICFEILTRQLSIIIIIWLLYDVKKVKYSFIFQNFINLK